MLHYDEGGRQRQPSVRFFDPHACPHGVPFDIIGLSYYTFFHGPLTALRDNVDDLATRYGKKIVIAESQYAWTLAAGGDSTGNFVWQASQIEPGYPATPGGQLSVLHKRPALDSFPASRTTSRSASSTGSPSGSRAWGWTPGAGTPNDNLTLFSFTGAALPSVGLFQSPAGVCERYAPDSSPCIVG